MEEPAHRRRRDETLLEAIRLAVRTELDEQGYSGVTFEGVARRARTSKSVLYRRYGSRAHLVIDAIAGRLGSPATEMSTGSLRGDLLAALDNVLEQGNSIGQTTFNAIIVEAEGALLNDFLDLATATIAATLERALRDARVRGEVGPSPVPALALRAPVDVLRGEFLESGREAAAGALPQIVDEVALPLFLAHASRQP